MFKLIYINKNAFIFREKENKIYRMNYINKKKAAIYNTAWIFTNLDCEPSFAVQIVDLFVRLSASSVFHVGVFACKFSYFM